MSYVDNGKNRTKKCDEKSKIKAKQDAMSFSHKMSDELDLTTTERIMHTIPDNLQCYLVGFIDGDGCIRISNGKLDVSVSQSSCDDEAPKSLLLLQTCFGGSISNRGIRKGRATKPEWSWILCGRKCKRVLELIATRGITKAPQARLALEALTKNTNKSISAKVLKLTKDDIKHYDELITSAKKEYQQLTMRS